MVYLFDPVAAAASAVEVYPTPRPQFLTYAHVLRTQGRGHLSREAAFVGPTISLTVRATAAAPKIYAGIYITHRVFA